MATYSNEHVQMEANDPNYPDTKVSIDAYFPLIKGEDGSKYRTPLWEQLFMFLKDHGFRITKGPV